MNTKDREICKIFGAQVRRIRIAQGFGKREFALHADIEYSQLSKIERGDANPTLITVELIADGLGIQMKELFDFKTSSKSKK